MNNSKNRYICGIPMVVAREERGIVISYENLISEKKRNRFYEALGSHCLAEVGVVGGQWSTIITDFQSIDEALDSLPE